MNYLLLLGAGFSRNWGGWLAAEAFEYLLGCPEIAENDYLKTLLWKYRRDGGFEAALSEVQTAWRTHSHSKTNLDTFQSALEKMFNDMNRAFYALADFEFQNHREFTVRRFLTRFDAIFTLNQDLLLEYQYLNGDHVQLMSETKWHGGQLPGIRQVANHQTGGAREPVTEWVVDSADKFKIEAGTQPYFKLHGSSKWRDGSDRDILIMGGDKDGAIRSHDILKWYHKQFVTRLSKQDTRLMVIGYSFGDAHINKAIIDASKTSNFRVFIINPSGSDAISNTNRTYTRPASTYTPNNLETALHPVIIGASRRSMREIFNGNAVVEYSKVMRFFE